MNMIGYDSQTNSARLAISANQDKVADWSSSLGGVAERLPLSAVDT
jgi:hypothetical protein